MQTETFRAMNSNIVLAAQNPRLTVLAVDSDGNLISLIERE